jgi:hypothetical protein
MSHMISFDDSLRPRAESAEAARGRVRARTVALPVEHGGWSIALEPVALGLLVAPSLAGCFLAIATLGAFLARQPLKLVLADRRRGRRFPRTAVAEKFLALYAGIAIASALAATATAVSYAFLLPLLLSVPLVAVQLACDATGRSRALAPELAGSVGLAAVAASIALADGWTLQTSSALWALLALRFAPTILYVRARLRLLHRESPAKLPVLLAHVAAFGLACLLAWTGAASLLVVPAFLALLLRARIGLAARQGEGNAKRVGISEILYGALTVCAIAAGQFLR